MTVTKVSIKPRRLSLTANGILTDFDFDFKIFAEGQITVYLLDTDGVATLQTITTDYTVEFDSEAETGTITFLTPPTDQYTVLMISNVDYEQSTDIPKGGGFSEPVVEKAYDLLAIQIQQLKDEVDRCVQLAETSLLTSITLPDPEAGAPIGWNATADGLTNNPTNTNLSQIDVDASPDFIGANAGDGVLRVDSSISYADGGDFITLSVNEAAVDHDQLLNFSAAEHFTMLDEDDMASDSNTQAATQQSIRAYVNNAVSLMNEFTELTDTPADYTGHSLKLVRVNAGETGLEFYTLPAADTITVEDEGTPLTTAVTKFNFAGAGVTVTEPVADEVLVTIPGGGGSASLTQDVNQTTHGFSVNDWVYHNGTIYALADASAASTAESIGVVSAVTDVDNFTVQFGGRITGLSGLTAGEAHFLSETAGAITATAPTTEGAVVKPVLIADSTTSGFIFNMRGVEITGTTSWYQAFTNANLSGGVLTVNHNLGHKYCLIQVYDENDDLIQPDDITLTDANNASIDLTSYGTISGTWHVIVLDVGTTNSSVASDLSLSGQAAGDIAVFDGANWVAKKGRVVQGWARFNCNSGTPILNDSFNVASVTYGGSAGDYTINWTTAFSDANYCVVASINDGVATINTVNAGSVRLILRNYSGTPADYAGVHVIAISND
jgi:hypothetical protein